jgi:SAM-dependent methyltransferase
VETPFDAAVFESAVHHFLNPVAALRNAANGLRAGGVLAIIEGASPEADFRPHFKQNVEAMERYRTLERPYTRPQMERLLELAGFPHFQFFHPVNGLFEQVHEVGRRVGRELLTADNWNIVVAGATPEPVERVSAAYRKGARADPRVRFMEGFYAEEVGEGAVAFRWSEPRSLIRLRGARRLRLEISTSCPQNLHKDQQVWVYVDGALSTRLTLTERAPRVPLVLDDLEGKKELQLYSDCLFSPFWFGPPDDRSLSFMVEVKEIG